MAKPAFHRPPKYRKQKRPRSVDQAFVELNGKRHYLGPYEDPKSREAYHRLIAEWTAQGGQLPVAVEEIAVVELNARFWQHVQASFRDPEGQLSEYARKIYRSLKPVRQLYGLSQANEFGPLALKTIRDHFIQRGLARSTINESVGFIKMMFAWGVANELVDPSVHYGLSAVKGLRRGRSAAKESQRKRPVPDAHIEAIRDHVSRQVWGLIQLQLFTGAARWRIAHPSGC